VLLRASAADFAVSLRDAHDRPSDDGNVGVREEASRLVADSTENLRKSDASFDQRNTGI
jgi:hypothetical protein